MYYHYDYNYDNIVPDCNWNCWKNVEKLQTLIVTALPHGFADSIGVLTLSLSSQESVGLFVAPMDMFLPKLPTCIILLVQFFFNHNRTDGVSNENNNNNPSMFSSWVRFRYRSSRPGIVLLQISFHLKEKFSSVAKDISRSPPPPVSKGVAPIWHGNLIVQWTKTPSLPLDISFAFRVAPETLLSSGFFP